ncbi:hypothetical protein B296_00046223 [Ensete ventricosum]|uniref:Uncharacterized protein n=1 Tax=Ensete ventricosum TaxID=4639 RepID=A0A426YGH8_ENSVE|nr:hypothetical protein B296_00046223 [Ensete ventricosum]
MKTPTYWYSVERNEVASVHMHRESLYQITIHRRSAFSTVSRFFFSLFFFLPPSADTARNRLPTIEIDYYRSILDDNGAKTVPISGTAW